MAQSNSRTVFGKISKAIARPAHNVQFALEVGIHHFEILVEITPTGQALLDRERILFDTVPIEIRKWNEITKLICFRIVMVKKVCWIL